MNVPLNVKINIGGKTLRGGDEVPTSVILTVEQKRKLGIDVKKIIKKKSAPKTKKKTEVNDGR